MSQRQDNSAESGEPGIPTGLADALRSLDAPPTKVPNIVDGRILADARRQIAESRRRGRRRIRVIAGLAAAVVVVFVLPEFMAPVGPPAERVAVRSDITSADPSAVSVDADVDGNGRVDILDAMKLALRVSSQQGAPDSSPSQVAGDRSAAVRDEPANLRLWDMNRDGRLDRRDVDAVAMLAVRLNGGPSS